MNVPAGSPHSSLKHNLLRPLLLTCVALAAATLWAVHAVSRDLQTRQLRLRGELIANSVNYAVESIANPGGVQRIVAAIGAEADVKLIVVVGGHPARVLASTRFAWIGRALAELTPEDGGEDLANTIRTRKNSSHIYPEDAELCGSS